MEVKFIVDIDTKKIHGPYKNKRKMEKDLREIKKISNMFLELGTNVFIISQSDLINCIKNKQIF